MSDRFPGEIYVGGKLPRKLLSKFAKLVDGYYTDWEEFCREHNLPFARFSDGKYEYDPEMVEFRPDLTNKSDRYLLCDKGQNVVIRADAFAEVIGQMAKLVLKDGESQDAAKQLKKWHLAFNKLADLIPQKYPPLPEFTIG